MSPCCSFNLQNELGMGCLCFAAWINKAALVAAEGQAMQTCCSLTCPSLLCFMLACRTALHEHHGKAPHSATYWIARQRDDRAAQLGSRACRRLTWDETGTRRPPQQQQVKYQQHRHAAAQQPHGQPVQPARSRAQVHAASCLTIEEALEQQEREWQRLDRTAARLLRMVRRGRCKPWKTAPAKL